jgi:LPS sulfotransferase NodH
MMRPADAFVLTTGRSGSTLLSDLLGLHPELLALSEFFTALAGTPRPRARAVVIGNDRDAGFRPRSPTIGPNLDDP